MEGGLIIVPDTQFVTQVLTSVLWPLFYNSGAGETSLRVPKRVCLGLTPVAWEQQEEERKGNAHLSPGWASSVSVFA